MFYREYGKTGKNVSVISFGGMRFENPSDVDGSAEIVYHAYRRGINYFDTAPDYCDKRSEMIMGEAFKSMKPGTFYVSTKSAKAKGGELRAQLEESLKRLGVDRIHFFHIWCIITLDKWEERKRGGAVDAALRAREEGLVDHVVVSSHLPGADLREVLEENIFEGVTLGYNVINFPYREEAVNAAGRLNLGVVTMNPLGGGIIPSQAGRFSFIKSRDDISVVQAALRFNLSNPNITSALVGFSNKGEVDEAVSAVKNMVPYTHERVAEIEDHIFDSFNGICTGCGYCLPCPGGVDIPKMMDSYNMKILKNNSPDEILKRLNMYWDLPAQNALQCTQCGECEEKCTQHLPIIERLDEIGGLSP